MNKPNFSIALIARNEEDTLPRMVESLKEYQERGGDICVLDTGSTDNTVEVAKSLGCKVEAVGDKFRHTVDEKLANEINEKFVVEGERPVVKAGDSYFDFASARNHAASMADNDTLFAPDCDEIFTALDIDKVCDAVARGVEQLEYQFVFSHDQNGQPFIQFTQCKFYNKTKLKWVGIIHEVLQGAAKREYFGEDVIKLEHYQNEKTNRSGYLKGLAIDCYNNPDNDRNSHYFAREMFYLGRYKSAIKEFENHISMGRWAAEASQSMLFIGDCYKALGNTDEMLKWYIKSVEKEMRREPFMRLAEYYFGLKQYKQVVAYCQAALSVTQLPFYSNHQPYYEHIPHELLYIAYWWLNDREKSKEHYEKALAFVPHNPKYIEDGKFYKEEKDQKIEEPTVSFVIPTLGREEGLKKCLESIEKLNYNKDKVEVIVKQDSFENRIGVPKNVKQGVEEATGKWIVFGSNDIEFTPESINEAVNSEAAKGGFVAFNTGPVSPDKGNICEHFMIRRDIIALIGEVFDTRYYHVGVDNLLWNKMKKLGIAKRCEEAVVVHNHFSKGAEMDETYKLGWKEELVLHDRALLEEDLKKLNEE